MSEAERGVVADAFWRWADGRQPITTTVAEQEAFEDGWRACEQRLLQAGSPPERATDHPYAGRSQSDVCLVCGRPRDQHAEGGARSSQPEDPPANGWVVWWDQTYWAASHCTKRGLAAGSETWHGLWMAMMDAEVAWDEAAAEIARAGQATT